MKVRLKILQQEDLPMVRAWRNDESIREYMFTDHFITEREHLCWFFKAFNDKTVKHFICEIDDEPIGYVNFVDINTEFKRAYWGFYLNPLVEVCITAGVLMEFCAIEYAFKELQLHKLCCEVLSSNPRVLAMHQKMGFTVEGSLKQHILKKGKYLDVWTLGLFIHDWLENYRPILIRRLCIGKHVNIDFEVINKGVA